MRDLHGISDQDIDRLLAGTAPDGGAAIDAVLARFIREAGAAFATPLPPETEQGFLAAAIEASRLAIDKGEPAAKPASKAHGPGRQASGLPKWRRRAVLSSLFASLSAKIAGVAIAAVAATGGLAAAGALPGPAQQAVSNAASTIGIHVPSGHSSPSASDKGAAADNASVTATAASDGVNHGNCVSYAASITDTLGLTGSAKGDFISSVAKDSSAVSAKVSGTEKPDAACQKAIDAAKAAANDEATPGKSGQSHGPSVTGTDSSSTGVAHNPNDFGPGEHPTGAPSEHPDNQGSSVTSTSLPTPTDHPTGRP